MRPGRAAVRRPRRARPARASRSTSARRRRSRRSAGGWTGCRWRSSSPPRGCARCRSSSSPRGWTTASGCSPAAAAPRCRATARCARSWTGAGTCSRSPSAGSPAGLAVFSAGATEESAAASAASPTRSTGSPRSSTARCCRSIPGSGPPRYRMLETIREYALEKLDEAGELEATRTRARAAGSRRWPNARSPTCAGTASTSGSSRLQAEHDDVIAALRWFGDAGDARAALRLDGRAAVVLDAVRARPRRRAPGSTFAVAVPGDADPSTG